MDGLFGLTADNWLRIILAVVFVLASYTVVPRIFRRLLRRLARRTESTLDDVLLEAIQPQIRWLVLAVSFQAAVSWLSFLGEATLDPVYPAYW